MITRQAHTFRLSSNDDGDDDGAGKGPFQVLNIKYFFKCKQYNPFHLSDSYTWQLGWNNQRNFSPLLWNATVTCLSQFFTLFYGTSKQPLYVNYSNFFHSSSSLVELFFTCRKNPRNNRRFLGFIQANFWKLFTKDGNNSWCCSERCYDFTNTNSFASVKVRCMLWQTGIRGYYFLDLSLLSHISSHVKCTSIGVHVNSCRFHSGGNDKSEACICCWIIIATV